MDWLSKNAGTATIRVGHGRQPKGGTDMAEPQADDESPFYRLMLFVANGEPNSAVARANLKIICREELRGNYKLEIVDVLENAQPALEHNVVVTPALLVLAPPPTVIIAGSLRDRAKVRNALRLSATEAT